MITKEHEIKKYCLFYASDFHLEMILLPYIKKNIYKDKFMIFSQENLSESIKVVLNRINLNSDEKNMMLNLNWDGKENLEEKDLNNYTIIINGDNEYISKINDKINKTNPDKINIIDCYSINDKNIEPHKIKEKYDDILNTRGYKKI